MQRYSFLALARKALGGHRGWEPAWRKATPKKSYDVVIVGGGGHGLSTAYYLARNHGITNVALVERGWIGGGNVGRNTTIVRSNYLLPDNQHFYEWSLKLWHGLSEELNYNVMFSARSSIFLATSLAGAMALRRRGNGMRLAGIDAEWLEPDDLRRIAPNLDYSDNALFPIYGGMRQGRAGTARHDAVAWGYARAASNLGVDIIEDCEVLGFLREGERVTGVMTAKGPISADRVCLATAGSSSTLTRKLGLKLPIESHLLQAFVGEGLKPVVNQVFSWSGSGHFYISQSDKGGLVFGGDLDGYNSYAQRGNLPVVEDVATAAIALMPNLSRTRILRHWAGVMDMSMDGSPIIGLAPIDGLYLNMGWCYGGFKAIPGSGWVCAHTIAHGEPHELNRPFALDRFERGRIIDENGVGPIANRH
ncbi:sarcosine oxidase subunit beta family protein [Inquilinus limosus]|uniref:sarcosine oxidase subunit beta family protein n=1 Tax=Inquilinus limosus TaxID=171674 RepID=UPI003F136300